MGTFRLPAKSKKKIKDGEDNIIVFDKEDYNSFNESILGLGDISTKSLQTNALSVIFDLEGFTNFCKQIDPDLAVPEYLSKFLKWIFDQVRAELIAKEYDEGFKTWTDLPFLSKYLGDGILFLWDTKDMSDTRIQNVVVSMYEICTKYTKEFLPEISKEVSSPPSKLRCGIARGTIYSVGEGSDFVGPCINMSARLQKLYSLSFCFSRRGIDPNKMDESVCQIFTVKKVDIRGIGDKELVCILKSEFDKLAPEDKKKFSDA